MSPDEALAVWADHGSCDSIGPDGSDKATEVIDTELERLRAIEQRAREVLAEGAPDDDPISRGAEGAARRILGET